MKYSSYTNSYPALPENRRGYNRREIAFAAAKVLLPYLAMACILLLTR